MTRKSRFSFSHPYDIRCYMRRLTQWEMRRSLITSREYEKDTFLPLSGLALVITLVIIYFWGKKKQPHLTHSQKAKFSNKTSLLRLNKMDLISRHFPTCFKGRKKLSHTTHCHRVKFHRKRSTSRNKAKYVVKYSIHRVLLFEITVSKSTLIWTQRLFDFNSKTRHFDRYHRASLSQFLLLLSGDVESNPGPYTDGDVKEVLQTVCTKTLSEDDWDEVVSALEPLESRWRDIGRKLGMRPGTLDSISADHSKCGPCLSEVVKQWLKLNYVTSKFSQPCWKKLAEAVSTLDKRLFYSLAEDHKAGGEESLTTKKEQACLSEQMKLLVEKPNEDNAEADILEGNSSEGSTHIIPLPTSDTLHLTGQPDGDPLSATQTLDSQLTSFEHKSFPTSGEEEKHIDADPPCTVSGAVPNPTTSPQTESNESNKRKKEKAKFEAPPLSVENVVTILEQLSLDDVRSMLNIPRAKLDAIKSEFSTDKECLRALIQYWLLRDPYASWRRLIIRLDNISFIKSAAAAANSIRNYAEKLTDPSLTCSRVLAVLDSVKDNMDGSEYLELCLQMSHKIIEEIRRQSSSAIIYRKKLVKYWLKYHPHALWEGLAWKLLDWNENQALDKVKRNIIKPKKDPSLTLTNLTQLMEKLNSVVRVRYILNIPKNVYDDTYKQYSNNSKRKEILGEWYLNKHPAPSWQHIADGLYCRPSQHEALEVLRSLYLKGSRESRRLCDEAIKIGHVKSQINKIVLYGPAGAGKSSFLEMVTGNSPLEPRVSTPVATRPVQLFQVDTTSKEWVKLSMIERKEILARAAMGAKCQPVNVTMCQTDSEDVNVTGYQTDSEDDSDKEAEIQVGTSSATEQLSSTQDTRPQMHSSTIKPTDFTPAGEVSQADGDSTLYAISTKGDLAELMDSFSMSGKTVTSVHKLQIIDSGGQPQFHEILPKFLRRMTLYIFVLKLSEDLTTKPMVEYFNQSGRIGTPYQSFHTNEQLIEHCLRTVHTHRFNTKTDKECSRIMVVGTHLDEESKCTTETIEEKNKKLEKLLLPMFKDEVMYYGDKFIFPVNAKNPGDHEKSMVKLIQHDILTKCSPEPIDVPLQYYGLELLLEESGKGVLSKEECLQAALDLHFDEHTLDAALQFLDEISVVFYFPEILPSVVFTNPQVLLDKVTELVEETYHLRKGGSLVISGDMQEFRDHGRFTLKFLCEDKFKKHYIPGLFTPKELVKLFKKLLIIAEFSSTEFFMPALLPVLEDGKISKYHVTEDSPAVALALDFPLGAPRLGTYCTLSCFLVSHDNQFPCPWKINLLPYSNTPALLYRNCIQFSVPDYPGSVTLIDTFKHFEVHVITAKEEYFDLCTHVRQAILTGIKKAAVTLGYNNATPSPAFLCSCGVGDPHVARFGKRHWICSLNPQNFETLKSHHLMWLDQADHIALQGSFNLKSVRNTLWEARGKWYHIGVELDIETSTLDIISTECQGKVEDCFTKVLTKWLNCVEPQPSWSALVEALESPAVDHPNLANKIRSKHKK